MDSHLVAVEVRVERRAAQRVELNRSAFHEHRLKRLDTQSVQGRCTVQHNGVVFDDNFKCIPNFGLGAFHHFSCRFDIAGDAGFDQTLHNKRFEQFQRHFFGKTALVNFQFRADDDNRTAGVVNTFTEKILTETTLFTFQHIGKGFQRAVVGAGDRSAAAAVINQGVDRFLEHSFFVADDDFRRVEFQKPFQTIVTVNHAAVQVV